jgi:hypothetical protein
MPAQDFDIKFVAFVDILGFRRIVMGMAANHERFELIRDILAKIDQEAANLDGMGQKPAGVAFSDSYVITGEHGWRVVQFVARLTTDLLTHGILSRGGVAYGPVFHEERVVFGPAMIEAYDLERNVAKYPRVILSPQAYEAIQAQPPHRETFQDGVLLYDGDRDGCHCINTMLPPVTHKLAGDQKRAVATEFLSNVRSHIEKNLRDLKDLDQRTKWMWLRHRFNEELLRLGIVDLLPVQGGA